MDHPELEELIFWMKLSVFSFFSLLDSLYIGSLKSRILKKKIQILGFLVFLDFRLPVYSKSKSEKTEKAEKTENHLLK